MAQAYNGGWRVAHTPGLRVGPFPGALLASLHLDLNLPRILPLRPPIHLRIKLTGYLQLPYSSNQLCFGVKSKRGIGGRGGAMNLKSSGIILVGLGFLFSGCEEFQQPKPANTKIVKESRVPVRRFILTKYDADVAFDTQTGQLCKTWEWQPMAKLTPQQEASGVHPPRALGEFSPTCISLYSQYPSGVGTTTEVLPDE
jgi:hypothetical protein